MEKGILEPIRPLLKKSTRWLIYFNFLVLYYNCAISGGILIFCGAQIKLDLTMMDLEYGLLGSMYSLGRMVGAVLFMHLANNVNRKLLMIFASLLQAFSNMAFNWTVSPYILLSMRLLSGVGFAFAVMYGGAWVGQFGVQRYKGIWTSVISVMLSFGVSSGSLITYLVGNQTYWHTGYYINGACLILNAFIFAILPNIYFSSKLIAIPTKDGEVIRKSKEGIASIYKIRESEIEERRNDFLVKHKAIFTNPIFMLLSLTKVLIVSSSIIFLFFIPGYLQGVLKFENKEETMIFYLFINCIAPIIGSKFGPLLIQLVGGYTNKNSILVLLFLQIIGGIIVYPLTCFDNPRYFMISSTLYQFFSSAQLPSLVGVMIGSLEDKQKAAGTKIQNVMTCVLATFPVPSTYGYINDAYAGIDNRMAMRVYSRFNCFGVILLILAMFVKKPFKGDNKSDKAFEEKEKKVVTEPYTGHVNDAVQKKGNDDDEEEDEDDE